jgi:hypothetical protein
MVYPAIPHFAKDGDCIRDSRSVFHRRIYCLSTNDFAIHAHPARSCAASFCFAHSGGRRFIVVTCCTDGKNDQVY